MGYTVRLCNTNSNTTIIVKTEVYMLDNRQTDPLIAMISNYNSNYAIVITRYVPCTYIIF